MGAHLSSYRPSERKSLETYANALYLQGEARVRRRFPAAGIRIWVVGSLMLTICLAGVAILTAVIAYSRSGGDSVAGASKVFEPQPTLVRVVRLASTDVLSTESYTGAVKARYEPVLAFRVGGKIVARVVDVGDHVSGGELIAELESSDYQLEAMAAEARLAEAKAAHHFATAENARQSSLLQRKATSASLADNKEAEEQIFFNRVEVARRELDLARNRLEYCTLNADSAGTVTRIFAEVGQVVAPGQTIAQLALDGGFEAVVDIPENRLPVLARASAHITLWSKPEKAYSARVREVSPVADEASRTYRAAFAFDSCDEDIVLGMTATVHLSSAELAGQCAIPTSALIGEGSEAAVWIVESSTSRVRKMPVVVRANGHSLIVEKGVGVGDIIVTAGVQKLEEGMLVRPWERP